MSLRRLGRFRRQPPPDGVLGFSCIRDEALRLPWFLEYHRQLGVGGFYVVDNGSTDGSTAFLLAQPDVEVYYTEDSYAESGCGIDWINQLLAAKGCNRWTLTLDADELLVYPGCEQHGLRELTAHLRSAGADALQATLIDMYAEGPIKAVRYVKGAPFLEACPYFDSGNYAWGRGSRVPSRGGPRARAFWGKKRPGHPAPYLPKVPLVEWHEGRRYEASTHRIDGVTPAGVTAALLHFKFFGDFPSRARLEAKRGEHFSGARQYAVYDQVMTEEPDLALTGESSVRYRDSSQLVDLGLLRKPVGYPW